MNFKNIMFSDNILQKMGVKMFQDLINEWIKHIIVPHWKSKNKFSIEIYKYCKNCKIENRMDSKLIMYLYRYRTVKYVLSTPSFFIVN